MIDGCPPNIPLTEKDIQTDMDRRRPGQSKFTTQRKELDKVIILSGVFEGKTTGTPISIIIYNEDKKSCLLFSFGFCSGLIVHCLVLAFGLSAIIEQNDNVIMFFKYFGSVYLFYLAFQEFKKDRIISERQKENFYLRGVYMNLINPKVLIFFLAYFPNFLFSDTISTSSQFIILVSIFILSLINI